MYRLLILSIIPFISISQSLTVINPSFEGGQTPYFRRIPKKGFSNYPFKKSFSVINLSDIEMKYSDGETVNRETLISKNILKRKSDLIKILALGSFTKKVKFDVDKISDSAKDKIIKAGGEIVENVE